MCVCVCDSGVQKPVQKSCDLRRRLGAGHVAAEQSDSVRKVAHLEAGSCLLARA